jgi:hypothetical protein
MRARAVVGRFEGHLIHHHWITVMDIGAVSKGAAPCLWIVQACEASLFPIRQLGADRHHAPAGGMWRSAMRRAGMESKWFFGRYGFVFRNARLVPFRPCRGSWVSSRRTSHRRRRSHPSRAHLPRLLSRRHRAPFLSPPNGPGVTDANDEHEILTDSRRLRLVAMGCDSLWPVTLKCLLPGVTRDSVEKSSKQRRVATYGI